MSSEKYKRLMAASDDLSYLDKSVKELSELARREDTCVKLSTADVQILKYLYNIGQATRIEAIMLNTRKKGKSATEEVKRSGGRSAQLGSGSVARAFRSGVNDNISVTIGDSGRFIEDLYGQVPTVSYYVLFYSASLRRSGC